jgi:hypothetical protein
MCGKRTKHGIASSLPIEDSTFVARIETKGFIKTLGE